MSNNFKKQAAQQRVAIPQIDPESAKPVASVPVAPMQQPEPIKVAKEQSQTMEVSEQSVAQDTPVRLTQIDTSETPTNRGFSMYPSRHRQVAKDLAYLEDRNPWEIIEDALEEYVVKHYGKDHKRK